MSHHTIDYKQIIRDKGYRITPQREAIMDVICGAGAHFVSIDDIYKGVVDAELSVDRSTVYRTVDFLTEVGLVTSSKVDGVTVYELTIGREPHHHLICEDCDMELELDHTLLMPLFHQLSEQHGFDFDHHNHLVIKGKCPQCRGQ